MERRTIVDAEKGTQAIHITREFDLPLELLFRAYEDPDILAQWMGTHVLKLENKKHGSYQFETTDPKGNKHRFNGTIHDFVPNQRITRTFEMEDTPFPVQLEFLEFQNISEETSRLTMHIVFRTIADRDRLLQMPFAKGINMAHNRLQTIAMNLQ